MTIESSVAALTSSTTALVNAVGVQQLAVTSAIASFSATTARVNALNNINNTSDANKPVSIAAQMALDLKQVGLVSGISIKRVNGLSLLGEGDLVIERSATSLNFVAYEERATLRTLSAQLDDSTLVESLGLFMWVNTKLEPDDDETCFSTAAGQWLLRAPAWDFIDAWNLIEKSCIDDWMEDEPKRFAAYLLANK